MGRQLTRHSLPFPRPKHNTSAIPMAPPFHPRPWRKRRSMVIRHPQPRALHPPTQPALPQPALPLRTSLVRRRYRDPYPSISLSPTSTAPNPLSPRLIKLQTHHSRAIRHSNVDSTSRSIRKWSSCRYPCPPCSPQHAGNAGGGGFPGIA